MFPAFLLLRRWKQELVLEEGKQKHSIACGGFLKNLLLLLFFVSFYFGFLFFLFFFPFWNVKPGKCHMYKLVNLCPPTLSPWLGSHPGLLEGSFCSAVFPIRSWWLVLVNKCLAPAPSLFHLQGEKAQTRCLVAFWTEEFSLLSTAEVDELSSFIRAESSSALFHWGDVLC